MVLQRIEWCSDREAADQFSFDARWKYAAGGLDFDYPEFAHKVLVDMRARLARSARPGQIFEAALDAARQAGLTGRRRVPDSTPLDDAVATMDTVTLVRPAVRGLLRAAGGELAGELRSVLARDDDYAAAGKPACDYEDPAARDELVDAHPASRRLTRPPENLPDPSWANLVRMSESEPRVRRGAGRRVEGSAARPAGAGGRGWEPL